MWRHALLEIYCLEHNDCTEWPTGTPSDWIEKHLVAYCDGVPREYVGHIPLIQILSWRMRDWTQRLYWDTRDALWRISGHIECWFLGHDICAGDKEENEPDYCGRCCIDWPQNRNTLPIYLAGIYAWFKDALGKGDS